MPAGAELWDLCVVGAGPAGLFLAQRAAGQGLKVLVLEKNAEPGRKLLLTGQGQCNLTNTRPIAEFLGAYGGQGRFLKPALYYFDNQAAVAWFEAQGVPCEGVAENGKVFPKSRKAKHVLQALLQACQSSGAELRLACPVTGLSQDQGLWQVGIPGGSICARKVAIATGGASFPLTGSTGDALAWLPGLGHGLVPLRPGQAAVFLQPHLLKDHSGISFKGLAVTQWRQGSKLRTLRGDLLITHLGLSGPVIHNLSRSVLPGDLLALAFQDCPDMEAGIKKWHAALAGSKLKAAQWAMQAGLPKTLLQTLLTISGVPLGKATAEFNHLQRQALFDCLHAFKGTVQALSGLDKAMVTCGGVPLDEVDPKTLASRKAQGLYWVGEVLDVDGDTGGYDLQAAWSMGALAGDAIVKSLQGGA
jgi:predicted Rossmann fold flavoprotein